MIDWPAKHANNKYSIWYENLVENARNRILDKNVYVERHHIVPKSFGGKDNKLNLVKLTAREHYIAHALLWKMKFEGRFGSKMSYAFNTFIRGMRTVDGNIIHINSKIYESFKIHYSTMLSNQMIGEGNNFYGKKHSEETKKIIGEKSKQKIFKKGKDNPNFGKKLNISEEGKKRRINALAERWKDAKFREEMAKKRKEFDQTPRGKEIRESTSKRTRGIKRDPAIIEKTASKKRGKKAHEIFSPQALINMAEGRKHRVYSEEGRAKIIESARTASLGIIRIKIECPHCGTKAAKNVYVRFHGDNCRNKV